MDVVVTGARRAADGDVVVMAAAPRSDPRADAAAGVAGVDVVVTGMGLEAAARAAAVWAPRVSCVVVCGVAGACSPSVRPGDVVVASRLVDGAGAPVSGADAVLTTPSIPGAMRGTVCSAESVVDGAAGRASLHALGVDAVETEAAGWAAACASAATPLVVVRGIVDTPSARLGAAATLVRPGAVAPRVSDVVRLAAYPWLWGHLIRLGRLAAFAERRAAEAAHLAARAVSEVMPAP